MDEYLTPDELAKLLKIHRSTIYRMVKLKLIAAVQIGKQLRIPIIEYHRLTTPSCTQNALMLTSATDEDAK